MLFSKRNWRELSPFVDFWTILCVFCCYVFGKLCHFLFCYYDGVSFGAFVDPWGGKTWEPIVWSMWYMYEGENFVLGVGTSFVFCESLCFIIFENLWVCFHSLLVDFMMRFFFNFFIKSTILVVKKFVKAVVLGDGGFYVVLDEEYIVEVVFLYVYFDC